MGGFTGSGFGMRGTEILGKTSGGGGSEGAELVAEFWDWVSEVLLGSGGSCGAGFVCVTGNGGGGGGEANCGCVVIGEGLIGCELTVGVGGDSVTIAFTGGT